MMMRNKMMALAALNFMMVVPAVAADMTVSEPVYLPENVQRPAFDWSGFYAGAQAGYARDQIGFGGSDGDLNGGTFGLFGGYNFVFSGLVFGVENDFNYNWNDGDVVGLDWDGSARGRVGYAWDRVLLYGTAGLAVAGGNVDVAGVGKKDDILIGWTVGAGAEYALTDNLLLRADYRYSDFGDVDFGGALGKFEANQHRAMLGIGYKF